MNRIESLAGIPDDVRVVAWPVVGHDLVDGDAQILEALGRPLQEGRCGFTHFVLQYLARARRE